MTSYSWEYDGERRLDNFFQHWFVRSELVPGWSAHQGGLGPSSHSREEKTQTYLRRPCVSNPTGGPQENPNAERHKLRAKLALAEVDYARREEFKRLKERAETDQKLRILGLNNDIKRNWGWPFNQGVLPREGDEEKEESGALFPKPPEGDWDKKWDREAFGKLRFKKKTHDGKNGCICRVDKAGKLLGKEDPECKALEEFEQNFTPLVGDFGWHEPYLKWLPEEKNDKKSWDPPLLASSSLLVTHVCGRREAGFYWTGPEKHPAIMDQLVWKSLLKAGPETVAELGATKTVEAIQLGRPLEEPEELQRKRVYGKTIRFKDVKSTYTFDEETGKATISGGGMKEVKVPDGKYFETNVEVRDPLTGVPVFNYKQKDHTVTSSRGHGHVDKKVLLERKKTKLELMKRSVEKMDDEKQTAEHNIKKAHDKYDKDELPKQMAQNKIIVEEQKRGKLEKQIDEYEVRIRREMREIKAIETELELEEEGKGLLLPRSLVHAMPKDAITLIKGISETLGLVEQEKDKFYQSDSDSEEGEEGDVLAFFMGYDKQKRKGMKTEKYFGKNLIDPATGKTDEAVLKRKIHDQTARRKENNKAVADVYLSRSDGTSRFNKMIFIPPAERARERQAREQQQQVVDSMVKEALDQEMDQEYVWDGRKKEGAVRTVVGLEAWASADRRQQSTFGSSAHPRPKPVMQTIRAGEVPAKTNEPPPKPYMLIKTFTPPPTQRKEHGKVLPLDAVGPKCSSGKLVGGGYHNARFELVGWGPEDEEHFKTPQVGFSNRSAQQHVPASLAFAGRRVDAADDSLGGALDRGPLKPGLVHWDKKYNGPPPGSKPAPKAPHTPASARPASADAAAAAGSNWIWKGLGLGGGSEAGSGKGAGGMWEEPENFYDFTNKDNKAKA